MTEVSDKMNGLVDIRRQCRLNQWSMMGQEREDSGLSIRALCEQKGLHSLRHTFATNLINGVKQPDGTIKSLTVKQVADLLGHTTSEITEMYYVKRDNSRLSGLTDNFNF